MSYNSKYTGAEVDAALGKALTALQEHQDISGKQDVISDLAAIRSGASKGATAIQEHQDISGKINGDGNVLNLAVVSAVPSSPDAKTLYIII